MWSIVRIWLFCRHLLYSFRVCMCVSMSVCLRYAIQYYRALPSSPTNGSKVLSPVKYDAKFISVDLVFPHFFLAGFPGTAYRTAYIPQSNRLFETACNTRIQEKQPFKSCVLSQAQQIFIRFVLPICRLWVAMNCIFIRENLHWKWPRHFVEYNGLQFILYIRNIMIRCWMPGCAVNLVGMPNYE